MINISIKHNLNNVVNKIEMIPINVQSAIAEGASAVRSDGEVEIVSTSGGVEVQMANVSEDTVEDIRSSIIEKIKLSYKRL